MATLEDRLHLAVGISIAAALLIIVLFYEGLGLRGSIALLIGAPAAVMLGFYVLVPARDRLYNIGLYSLALVAALAVGGLDVRAAVALALTVVIAIAAYSLAKKG